MKKLLFFSIPFFTLIVLFRHFNDAGHFSFSGFFNTIKDFKFDFDKTLEFLVKVRNVWNDIDFFPYRVDSFSDLLKSVGAFFVGIFDFLKALAYSLGLVFTLIQDVCELLLQIFSIMLSLFGFNYSY